MTANDLVLDQLNRFLFIFLLLLLKNCIKLHIITSYLLNGRRLQNLIRLAQPLPLIGQQFQHWNQAAVMNNS